MSHTREKQLKIHAGIVKRIIKEKQSYEKEYIQIESRIEKMKAEGKDEYDIKKMHEVLNESKMMGPDCVKRLVAAAHDLKIKITDADDLKETEEYKEADKQLKEAEEILNAAK